jgi:hypothetical protein
MRTEEEAQKIRQNIRMEERAMEQFLEVLRGMHKKRLVGFAKTMQRTKPSFRSGNGKIIQEDAQLLTLTNTGKQT